MRFGVWTPLPHTIRPEPLMNAAMRESGTRGLANGPDKAFRFAVDMITRAEELGFKTTLLAERWIGTDHPAWMLAAALAALTRRIELMVAVHPGIITPQVVAKFTASLDRISGGRAAVNIVNGWWKEEFENFGHAGWPKDDDARYRRMDEFVRVMRGMWNEDTFEFHGEFYTVDRQGLPLKSVQLPNPPIYAGSRNEPGKEVIARDCDYWFVDCLTDYRSWEQNVEQAKVTIADLSARAARHGRKLGFGMSCHVVCAEYQRGSHEARERTGRARQDQPGVVHRRQGARPGSGRHARDDRGAHPPLRSGRRRDADDAFPSDDRRHGTICARHYPAGRTAGARLRSRAGQLE